MPMWRSAGDEHACSRHSQLADLSFRVDSISMETRAQHRQHSGCQCNIAHAGCSSQPGRLAEAAAFVRCLSRLVGEIARGRTACREDFVCRALGVASKAPPTLTRFLTHCLSSYLGSESANNPPRHLSWSAKGRTYSGSAQQSQCTCSIRSTLSGEWPFTCSSTRYLVFSSLLQFLLTALS